MDMWPYFRVSWVLVQSLLPPPHNHPCACIYLLTEELDWLKLSIWRRRVAAGDHRLRVKVPNHHPVGWEHAVTPPFFDSTLKPGRIFAPWSLSQCNQRLGHLYCATQGLSAPLISAITLKHHSMLRNRMHHHISKVAMIRYCACVVAAAFLQMQYPDNPHFPMPMMCSLCEVASQLQVLRVGWLCE